MVDLSKNHGSSNQFQQTIYPLLSDVIMYESEGVVLYDRLAPTRPGLRVLYMSGYANEAMLQRGLLSHGAAFLQNPFTPDALRRKVREVLDASATGI
jgi:two-component system cell cycle sensor histidine kinase/response regulator CckA